VFTTGKFDLIEYPTDYMGDFWPYLITLDDRIEGDKLLNWDGFLPTQQTRSKQPNEAIQFSAWNDLSTCNLAQGTLSFFSWV